jgi:glycerol-3-phosphate acyltransferase PlsX
MKVIVDAFGGDKAPLSVLKGSEMVVKECGVEIIAVGDVKKMTRCCKENDIDTKNITFLKADGVFDSERDPMDVVKKRTDTSMHVGFSALAEGKGDAFVSAGSTGAMLMGATFIVKRIKGCRRPALATVFPSEKQKGFMFIDCGANVDTRADMLTQFANMGSIYMEKVMGRKNPKVALLNNGTESTKGPETHRIAYKIMESDNRINFVGNIEGRYIFADKADVVVADGFSGNIALKTAEGMASLMSSGMKSMFLNGTKTKFAALLLKKELKEFKKKFDYREYGGAPILGVQKCVIKAHGSSDRTAIKNAIMQAKIYTESNVGGIIAEILGKDNEDNN